MDKIRLHPELRDTYARIPAVPFHNPLLERVLRVAMRLRPNRGERLPGVAVTDEALSHGAVRIYRPESGAVAAALLWIHGGGYIMGNTGVNDRECCALAAQLGLTVVSVDYRLAPKHPFPAPLDDCLEGWHFLQARAARWGVDPARVAIMGQSAGGGLAAALAQRIADGGGVQPAAQVLMYPMLDDRTALDDALTAQKHFLWNNRNNRGGWSWYLGQSAGSAQVPDYAVPARRADLGGLAPAWIGVGDLDLFYAEDVDYAERLEAAGVRCDLHVTAGAPHAFDLLVPGSMPSRQMLADCYRFIGELLCL